MHFCWRPYYCDIGKDKGVTSSTWVPKALFQMAGPRAKWWEVQVLESVRPEFQHQTAILTSCLILVKVHNFSEASVHTPRFRTILCSLSVMVKDTKCPAEGLAWVSTSRTEASGGGQGGDGGYRYLHHLGGCRVNQVTEPGCAVFTFL